MPPPAAHIGVGKSSPEEPGKLLVQSEKVHSAAPRTPSSMIKQSCKDEVNRKGKTAKEGPLGGGYRAEQTKPSAWRRLERG